MENFKVDNKIKIKDIKPGSEFYLDQAYYLVTNIKHAIGTLNRNIVILCVNSNTGIAEWLDENLEINKQRIHQQGIYIKLQSNYEAGDIAERVYVITDNKKKMLEIIDYLKEYADSMED